MQWSKDRVIGRKGGACVFQVNQNCNEKWSANFPHPWGKCSINDHQGFSIVERTLSIRSNFFLTSDLSFQKITFLSLFHLPKSLSAEVQK